MKREKVGYFECSTTTAASVSVSTPRSEGIKHAAAAFRKLLGGVGGGSVCELRAFSSKTKKAEEISNLSIPN